MRWILWVPLNCNFLYLFVFFYLNLSGVFDDDVDDDVDNDNSDNKGDDSGDGSTNNDNDDDHHHSCYRQVVVL